MPGLERRVLFVKKLLAALLALAALTGAGRAGADPLRYGVADDWPKFHPCGDVWWQSATDIGYQDFRMTVQWNEATPTEIPFQANIQAAIDCAKLTNLRPILAIYPQHPAAIGANAAAQAQFATFVSLVGQTFPDVRDIIIGNEPNVNRFWQPQYRGGSRCGGDRLRAHARAVLRRAEDGPSRLDRVGPCDLVARERQRERGVESEPLAGLVHQVPRRRLQGVGPNDADLR